MSARKLSKLDTIRIRIADWHLLGHELSGQVREEPKLLTEICSTCLHFRDHDCTCPDMVRVSKRTIAIQEIEKLARAINHRAFSDDDRADAHRIWELAKEALGA